MPIDIFFIGPVLHKGCVCVYDVIYTVAIMPLCKLHLIAVGLPTGYVLVLPLCNLHWWSLAVTTVCGCWSQDVACSHRCCTLMQLSPHVLLQESRLQYIGCHTDTSWYISCYYIRTRPRLHRLAHNFFKLRPYTNAVYIHSYKIYCEIVHNVLFL